jgi:hypothetical protein
MWIDGTFSKLDYLMQRLRVAYKTNMSKGDSKLGWKTLDDTRRYSIPHRQELVAGYGTQPKATV